MIKWLLLHKWLFLFFLDVFLVITAILISQTNTPILPNLELVGEINLQQAGLTNPSGILIDEQENYYISDSKTYWIYKFNSEGQFLTKWSGIIPTQEKVSSMLFIGLDSQNRLVVYDYTDWQYINKFDTEGNLVSRWKIPDGTEPFPLALDKQNRLYFNVEAGGRNTSMIKVFDSEGQLIKKFGSKGTENSLFSGLTGMAVDQEGIVYVIYSSSNWRYQGNSESRCDYNIERLGQNWQSIPLWQNQPLNINEKPRSGCISGRFLGIRANELFILESISYNSKINQSQIIKYSSTGKIIKRWGTFDKPNTSILSEAWITFDGKETIYAFKGFQIQKFKLL